MEYFKVKQQEGGKSIMEVNRDNRDLHIVLISEENVEVRIDLSPTESKDLAEFILKRLSEKEPEEANPF